MQRVNDGNVSALTDAKNRGRKRREPVVNMDDVRSGILERLSKIRLDGGRKPELPGRSMDLRDKPSNGVVIGVKPLHFDAICGEESGFSVNHGILAASLLIPVVNYQNFHLFLFVIALVGANNKVEENQIDAKSHAALDRLGAND